MAKKACRICNENKSLDDFYEYEAVRVKARCKSCIKKQRQKERDRDRKAYNTGKREYYSANKERCASHSRKYYKNNKTEIVKKKRIHGLERRSTDPVYKMKINIRSRLRNFAHNKNIRKKEQMIGIVGCNWEFLWRYLGDSFEANYAMSREYMGDFNYEIDHIVPLATAKTKEDLNKLNHYTNLQILLAEDNRKKSDSLDWSLYG